MYGTAIMKIRNTNFAKIARTIFGNIAEVYL